MVLSYGNTQLGRPYGYNNFGVKSVEPHKEWSGSEFFSRSFS